MTAAPLRPDGQAFTVASRDELSEELIKSRERVKAHGEVFTPRRMVEQMLDLVCAELETGPGFVDKTFFEPSAGDGNFLIAILRRKLHAIEKRYQPEFWPTESLFALASIYGVELLEDNLIAARAGLLAEFAAFHAAHGVVCSSRTNMYRSAVYLIGANVALGDTLTGLDANGEPIEFSWWHRVLNVPGLVQRDPFTLASLRGAGVGAFDFTVYATYQQCRIDQVHKEVRADD
ncbi:methylase [Microbacterium foliorum]|uniref:Methylase n=1 Tax=Microbacterium foliorum TaxID=104336 RepID=A0A4Y5YM40_9MICO|nr:methylase [Microbacterium foliorum]QDE33519.1 methylase [Microbacterium foliorum]